jgi:hypothetical protein
MPKTIEVTYFSTPRHGYFEVKGDDLRDLNISQSFSEYSYYNEDDDIFYLEEDCDASMFAKRCELDSVQLIIKEEDIDSEEEEAKIRCHNNAYGGDTGYFGELEQNHDGLEEFFEDESEEEDEE